MNSPLSYLLFITQILSLGYLIISGDIVASNPALFIIQIFFLLIIIWSIAVFRFRVNVLPEPLPKSTLRTEGPYDYIRHPMYTSLISLGIVAVVNEYTIQRLSALIILIIVLLCKIYLEEKMLLEQFGNEYKHYQKRSKAILPFIF